MVREIVKIMPILILAALLLLMPVQAADEVDAPGGAVSSPEELLTALGGEAAGWLQEGVVTLRSDLLLSAPLKITGGDLIINGAGCMIHRGFQHGAMLEISGDAVLTLGNERGSDANTTLILDGGRERYPNSDSVILASGNASLVMYAGTIIQSNASALNGGAVTMTGGTFTMHGGIIQDCSAGMNGGALYVSEQAVLHMAGGFLLRNSAENGGGVYFNGDRGAQFVLAGGTVGSEIIQAEYNYDPIYTDEDGNTAVNGGGLYLTGGTAAITSGFIIANKATMGGGVFNLDTELLLAGGSFLYNAAAEAGGALYTAGYTGVAGGEMYRNTTEGFGGGAFIDEGGVMDYQEGNMMSNTAEAGAGAIYNRGEFTMTGGSVNYNETAGDGGGMLNYGTFRYSGGSFGYNKSTGYCEGIISYGDVILSGDAFFGGTNEILLCTYQQDGTEVHAGIEIADTLSCTTTIGRLKFALATEENGAAVYTPQYIRGRTVLTGDAALLEAHAGIFAVLDDSGAKWIVTERGMLDHPGFGLLFWLSVIGSAVLLVGIAAVAIVKARRKKKNEK